MKLLPDLLDAEILKIDQHIETGYLSRIPSGHGIGEKVFLYSCIDNKFNSLPQYKIL